MHWVRKQINRRAICRKIQFQEDVNNMEII